MRAQRTGSTLPVDGDTGDAALVARLRGHVETLAGEIGERNVILSEALRGAGGNGGMMSLR